MFEFLKKNKSPVDVTEAKTPHQGNTAPGTSIHYQPEFIHVLTSDHHNLLKKYEEVGIEAKKKNFETALAHLFEFKRNLQTHLLNENIRLYVYLEHCFVNDTANANLVHTFRKEMSSIGVSAMNFLKKYQTNGISDRNVDDFLIEYGEVGSILKDRILKEESQLYPLYMPVEELSK